MSIEKIEIDPDLKARQEKNTLKAILMPLFYPLIGVAVAMMTFQLLGFPLKLVLAPIILYLAAIAGLFLLLFLLAFLFDRDALMKAYKRK